jgi:hypothetical protein
MGKLKIELKWAIIFSIASILWVGLERLMGWHDENIASHVTMTNIFAVVAILVYVFALLDKRNNFYMGFMSWKQGFISGTIMSVFVAILSPLALFISVTYVSPQFFENIAAHSVSTGAQTEAEAEAYFNLTNYMLQSAIFALVAGVITSAIVALFVKKGSSGPVSGVV